MRLTNQSGFDLFLVERFARQELERNGSSELGVLRLIDDTHAALTEFFGYAVVQYGPTDHDEEIVTLSDG